MKDAPFPSQKRELRRFFAYASGSEKPLLDETKRPDKIGRIPIAFVVSPIQLERPYRFGLTPYQEEVAMARSHKPSRSRSPRQVKLKVEQLESRLTPAVASVSGSVEVTAPANPAPAASPNEGENAATLDLVVLANVGSGNDVKSIKIENVYNLSVHKGDAPTVIHLDKYLKLDSGAEAEIKIEGLAGYKEVGDNPLAFLKLQNDPTIKLN